MLVTMTPLVAPIVIGLGYDPVWFGVLLTILLGSRPIVSERSP